MATETITMTTETIAVQSPESLELPSNMDMAAAKKARDATKWLHKTKLCVYSIQGTCRLGSKCSFAHTASEVQEAPNLHKTQLCEAFSQGNCTNENCTFAHGEEELRLSPNFKNKLCKWFGKGKCRNGAECGFAHGTEELRHQRDEKVGIAPPPGLSLQVDEADKKEPLVLDLEGSLLEAKAPASLEQQVEGMASTIAALQWKMDEMVLRTQVTGMKQFLGQLSDQCAQLEQALNVPQDSTATDLVASAPWKKKKTPLKTPLSSKAALFQPSSLSIQAQPFVPGGFQATVPSYECGETYWPSDDSTSIAEAGFSSDSGGFSSD